MYLLKIAVLISGNGSNLQAIIDKIELGALKCRIEMVISDREGAFGIERARKNRIPTYTLDRKLYEDSLCDEILALIEGKVDIIVLAGFLSIVKGKLLDNFENRIINIHPSLLPSFCGKGMYGIKVHEAAIDYGVKVSGCSVHFVDEKTDAGPVVLQRAIPVYSEDSAEKLQKRVLVEEHTALTEVLDLLSNDRVRLKGRKVEIIKAGEEYDKEGFDKCL
jgi:phosphoribosylglycinamide formyltransferase 1